MFVDQIYGQTVLKKYNKEEIAVMVQQQTLVLSAHLHECAEQFDAEDGAFEER